MGSDRRTSVILFFCIAGILSLFSLAGFFRQWQERLIDLLFTVKTPPANIVIVTIDEESIRSIGQWPWPRAVFADLIGRLQSAAVIGVDVNFKEPSRAGIADDNAFASALNSSRVPVILTAELQPDGSIAHPLNTLAVHTQEGYPNIIIDGDGTSRSIRFIKNGFPSFGLQIASTYTARVSKSSLPNIPYEPTRIRYLGSSGTFASVSALKVIQQKVSPGFFEQKIVLIGATAPDLQDFHQTPFGVASGVEIQANVVQTLLGQTFFATNKLWTVEIIFLVTALAIWLGTIVGRLIWLFITTLTILAAYNVIAFISFDHVRILDIFYPNLAILISIGGSITARYTIASKEKKFIQESFSRYLAPQVIHQLLHDPSQLRLGGVREALSILFSDIRNFTTMSEQMTPEELTTFLNQYLTGMTNIVLDHNGVIDKYIGDAIMAFWGAPLANQYHARDSILAALAMMDSLEAFNSTNQSHGKLVIDIGIGINSGDVTVGNMGSERRFDYTVMGDNVNLASRLEGLTKTYGVNIIASEHTIKQLPAEELQKYHIVVREIDRVKVKGKKQAVTLYQIVTNRRKPHIEHIEQYFNDGLRAYYGGNWLAAIEKFEYVLKEYPDDGPSRVLYERCQEFLHRPIEHWEGVFELTHK